MAKFSYRMQNILDIKYKMEEQAKSSFAAAMARLRTEKDKLDAMFARKKELEEGDPYYNPNLTLERPDCSIK